MLAKSIFLCTRQDTSLNICKIYACFQLYKNIKLIQYNSLKRNFQFEKFMVSIFR